MPQVPHIAEDPTIYVGLRLFDGTDYDTIVERVEYGGFGVIAFGPNRLDNQKMIAYKSLRRELLKDAQTRASFVRECLLWVGLWPHPNVAQAYGAFEMGDTIDQRPFLALEYADYGSLRTLLRATQQQANGRLPLGIALHLSQQVAAGLAYLHTPDPTYLRYEPTVHRDLKPENVLLMETGQAMITDFGLAKAVEASPVALALLLAHEDHGRPQSQLAEDVVLIGGDQATLTTGLHTAAGVALGTMAYMPPEQWRDAHGVGTAADIYALGIILSEILAGRHALLDLDQPQTQTAWRQAHLNPQPRPLRAVAPEVPEVVEAIYRRCLAADPAARPSAAEVLTALQAGAQAAGENAYTPFELAKHTPFNEVAHWHMWSIAYESFGFATEASARSDRALALARQLKDQEPDLLPAVLMERGTIMKALGESALAVGKTDEAAEWDRQAEAAYQEALTTFPPPTTPNGRRRRSSVWHQIGVFNKQRGRYDYAEDAYARALALMPDKADTYYARANNQWEWGKAEIRAGRRETGIEHLRQARIHVITALGLNYPTADGLRRIIEADLVQWGAANGA